MLLKSKIFSNDFVPKLSVFWAQLWK